MNELNEIRNKIDYKKKSLNDRKQIVANALETEFFNEYFDEYYQSNLKKSSFLAEENKVCKLLDQIANYLLTSDEVKQQSKNEQQEYKFYSDPKEFEKALKKEVNIESMLGESNSADDTIHFLKANEQNQKIVKNVAFEKKDLKRNDELSSVLNDYNNYCETVTKELNDPDSKNNRFVLTRIKGGIKEDMNTAKKQILGVFGENMNPVESTKYDISLFDLSNIQHLVGMRFVDSKGKGHNVKGLLFMQPTNDLTNDFNLLLIELQQYVENAKLNDLERNVARLIQTDLSQIEIANELNISMSKLRYSIKTIAKKVAKIAYK